MADQQKKHYVAPPQGRDMSDDDALAMGYALFDRIAAQQAAAARADDDAQSATDDPDS